MSELPHKLSKGDHRVIFRKIQEDGVQELKECIDRDYVHIKFTETQGGTELGFKLDPEHTDLEGADWEKGEGKIRLAGNLILDYVKVRCVADLDLATLEGKGHLDILEEEAEPASA
jgi:hypothetical protein